MCEHESPSSSFLKGLNCPQIQFLSKIPMDQGIPSPCALLSVAPVSHTSKKKSINTNITPRSSSDLHLPKYTRSSKLQSSKKHVLQGSNHIHNTHHTSQ